MTPATLDLGQILQKLEPHAADPLVFRYHGVDIGSGYHLTEFKRVSVDSIDCGAKRHHWSEARMQLLDGHGSDHMPVAKFSGIAAKSVAALGDLADLPLIVEFAPRNEGLRQLVVSGVQAEPDRVVVELADDGASCKPMAALSAPLRMAHAAVSQPCCGNSVKSTDCCG